MAGSLDQMTHEVPSSSETDLVPLGPGSSELQKEQSTTSKSFIGILVDEMQHTTITTRREYWYMVTCFKRVKSV